MPIHSRTAIAVASLLALSALSGVANAQPPASDAATVEPDDESTDAEAGAVPAEAAVQAEEAGGASGGAGSSGGAPVTSAAPAELTPAAVSPDTAPLGSSGGGGTGGNGRPTQDPVKDG